MTHGVQLPNRLLRLVHVFVALADNARQGIVPVPAAIGNGDDPAKNLYWGAAFGVRTYFKKSSDWKEVATVKSPNSYILERSVFVHGASGTYLIADAYRGREIKQAITDDHLERRPGSAHHYKRNRFRERVQCEWA